MRRFISMMVVLAFAGVLFVACEQKPDAGGAKTPPPVPAPVTPKIEAPKTPAPTTPAPTAPAPEAPKTGAAPTPAPASSLAGATAALNTASAAVATATTCALPGCGKTADVTKFSLTKDGKPIAFCCQNCLDTYKKNNNL